MAEDQMEDVEAIESADTAKSGKKHIDHRWSIGIIAGVVFLAVIVGTFFYVYYTNSEVTSYDSIQTLVVHKAKQSTQPTSSTSTTSTVTNQQLDADYQSATSKLGALDAQTQNVDSSLNDTPVNLNY